MPQRIAQMAILVRDYDEAIEFYVHALRFDLIENTELGNDKRWVRVRPAGSVGGAEFLLSKAVTPEQRALIGRQTGGRVLAFIETGDLARDYAALQSRGVTFTEPPRHEAYGMVAVFVDLYGNRFDLIQPL